VWRQLDPFILRNYHEDARAKTRSALSWTWKDQAIYYAENRTSFRSGEILILDSTGGLERTIPFREADRKL
jgi:hypothetical protein